MRTCLMDPNEIDGTASLWISPTTVAFAHVEREQLDLHRRHHVHARNQQAANNNINLNFGAGKNSINVGTSSMSMQ